MRNFILSFLILCIPCLTNAQDVQADVTSNLADWESTNHNHRSTDSKTYEFSAENGNLLSFDWYVSSEDNCDILTIRLDGNTIILSSGVNGETYTTTLTAGSHTLEVSYSKDGSVSANNDNAGIRNIKITDYIVFADAKIKAICVENWDTNHDGELSYSEAAAVTDIGTVFQNSEITSFNELQYFTRLTSIGDYAFFSCSGLTSIEIPNSVTSIGLESFAGCSGLTSIEIPNSVTSIGDRAFLNCSGLKSVTSFITDIFETGDEAFGGIPTDATLYVPYGLAETYRATADWNRFSNISEKCILFADDNVKAICVENWDTNHDGELSYSEASAVTNIGTVFQYSEITSFNELQYFTGLTSIGYNAVRGCSFLTSIVIPNSVTYIDGNAFRDCSALSSIEIPNSVTSIRYAAFDDCSALSSIEIPNSVTSIGNETFAGCSGLTSIEIPNSVTSIGNETFAGCSGLTNIIVAPDNPVYDSRDNCNAIIETSSNTLIAGCMNTVIPNTVTSIRDHAFYYCTGLTSIEIPNSVTYIGDHAFMYCRGLTSIDIPNSVTYIGDHAFAGCNGLTSINIPNSVTYIGSWAFNECYGLTSIEIPNSVTNIDNYTFYSCHGLTSIEIPNSVTNIGHAAFQNCFSMTSIKIPNSVTSIGDQAFYQCIGLTNVYCYAETVPSTGAVTFVRSNYRNATLHVPACAIDDYKNTEPWSGFGNIVPLDPMEFDLTVSDAGVATLYLDYSVAIPNVEGMGDVMYVSDVVDRTLVLTKVENNIPAYTGVIVYAQPGTYTLTSSTTHVDACENSQLSGVTQDTPTANIDGTVYTLSVGKNPEDIGFRKFVGETLAANKAFLVRNESNEVNFFNFGIDDELTGISTTVQNVDDESAIIYDLQGRLVTSPSKGIYIVNGKKRFINHR